MPSKKKKFNARFPPARIKKIMQTDEDVGKVASAVPVIISRALELFIESLILKSSETTRSRNAKTLSTAHIKRTIVSEKRFDFLKDLVTNVPDVQQGEEESEGLPLPLPLPLPAPTATITSERQTSGRSATITTKKPPKPKTEPAPGKRPRGRPKKIRPEGEAVPVEKKRPGRKRKIKEIEVPEPEPEPVPEVHESTDSAAENTESAKEERPGSGDGSDTDDYDSLPSSSKTGSGHSSLPPANIFPWSGQPQGGVPSINQSKGSFPPSSQSQNWFPKNMQSLGSFPPSSQSQESFPSHNESQGSFPPDSESQGSFPPSSQSQGSFPPSGPPMGKFPAISSQSQSSIPGTYQSHGSFPSFAQTHGRFPTGSQLEGSCPPGTQMQSDFPTNSYSFDSYKGKSQSQGNSSQLSEGHHPQMTHHGLNLSRNPMKTETVDESTKNAKTIARSGTNSSLQGDQIKHEQNINDKNSGEGISTYSSYMPHKNRDSNFPSERTSELKREPVTSEHRLLQSNLGKNHKNKDDSRDGTPARFYPEITQSEKPISESRSRYLGDNTHPVGFPGSPRYKSKGKKENRESPQCQMGNDTNKSVDYDQSRQTDAKSRIKEHERFNMNPESKPKLPITTQSMPPFFGQFPPTSMPMSTGYYPMPGMPMPPFPAHMGPGHMPPLPPGMMGFPPMCMPSAIPPTLCGDRGPGMVSPYSQQMTPMMDPRYGMPPMNSFPQSTMSSTGHPMHGMFMRHPRPPHGDATAGKDDDDYDS